MAIVGTRRTWVLSVGIGRFGVRRPALPFAASDARAFVAAQRDDATTRLLVDDAATTAALESAAVTLGEAGPDDAVCVFLVGPAERADGDVRLTTFDGTLSLGTWLRDLSRLRAGRVVVLLDVQRNAADDVRPSSFDLAPLFPALPSRTLVLADDGRGGSHVSGALQAGIWSAQVTAAFHGTSRARRPDGMLTAGSLRTFLADEVVRSLTVAYTDGRRQSPLVLAASDDEVLDEPPDETGAADTSPPAPAGIFYFTESETPVKSLGGFRKSLHTPPADTLASSQAWVARLAEPDLARELEETVARLRRTLGYKRRDVTADGPQAGAASILTPDFAFHITVRQHPQRPGQAVFRRTLDRIANLDVAGRAGFADAFPNGFQSLHVPSATALDLAALIDSIEDDRPEFILRIDYPIDLRYCDVELGGFDGRVRLERDGLTITAASPASPQELARQFALVRAVVSD